MRRLTVGPPVSDFAGIGPAHYRAVWAALRGRP
jgi:hypothetical protein